MTLPVAISARLRGATTADSADIPENDHLWRSLQQGRRDLLEVDQNRQREIAVWLWKHNGFGARYAEIMEDFTAGEDPHPKADDEALQGVLEEFWDDCVNQFRNFAVEIAGQLRILGEQFVTAHVRETDGRLRVGYIDPDQVGAVISRPGNDRELVEVHLKTVPGQPPRIYRIVRPGEPLHEIFDGVTEEGKRGPGKFRIKPRDPELVGEGQRYADRQRKTYDGIVVVRQVNRLSNATRGTSDLFATADYLDGLDKTTFNAVERSWILNTLALDVTVTGQDDAKELRKHQDTAKAAFSRPGGVYTHSDGVSAQTHSADLKSADMSELILAVKLAVLGSWGFPLAWFADPSDSNRATLSDQQSPTAKKLKKAQAILRGFLCQLCDLQIALKLALAPEELKGVEDPYDYEIILPQVVTKDTAQEATTLGQVTASISQATVEGWITAGTAASWWQQLVGEILGLEVRDEDRELIEKLDEEAEQEEMEPEPRPGDDGLEPELDDEGKPISPEVSAQQKAPLPPAMKAKAMAVKKAFGRQ